MVLTHQLDIQLHKYTGVFLVQATLCSSIIGYFVPADVWCKLVRAAVGTASGSAGLGGTVDSSVAVGPLQCEGCLLCFASLIQGGRKDQIFPELNVCYGRNVMMAWFAFI